MQQNDISQLSGNINKDITPNLIRAEDPTFVLNAIRDNILGGKPSYQSEPGNILNHLVDGKRLIGDIYGEDNEVYLFYTDNEGNDEIGLFKDDVYTQLVEANFNFNTSNPILGTYRVVLGCEKVIYWCDLRNPDRHFNVSKPDRFKTANNWDVALFSLKPDILPPHVDVANVSNVGGNLLSGTYFVQIEVLDRSLNVISRSPISQGVAVYFDEENLNYSSINGNMNLEDYSPFVGGKPVTSKAIQYTISNIDTRFDFIRMNVLRAGSGNGASVRGYTKTELIPISGSTVSFVLASITDMDTIEDISKFIVPNSQYYRSGVITQEANRLLRANVQELPRDYTALQRAASQVITKYAVQEVAAEDPTALGNPKNPATPYKMMSLLGDEIVAAGIVYLYEDGYEAPPMHIPGICKDGIHTSPLPECGRCLLARVTRTSSGEGLCNAEIIYTVNGEEFTWTRDNIFLTEDPFEFYEEDVFCGPGDIQVISWAVYDTANPEEISGEYDISPLIYDQDDCGDEITCLFLSIEPTTPFANEVTNVTINYTVGGDFFSHTVENKRNYFERIVCSFEEIIVIDVQVSNPSHFDVDVYIQAPPDTETEQWPDQWHSYPVVQGEDPNADHLEKYELDPNGNFVLDNEGNPIRRTVFERWEVYNTAYKLGNNRGWPAYHENSRHKYPDIKGCDGEDIWGYDACGNKLVGTAIRHHRLPDREIEHHYSTSGSVEEVMAYSLLLTIDTQMDIPLPIEVDITYDLGGNTITERYDYFAFGETQNMFTTDDEITNVVINVVNYGNGGFDIDFEVQSSTSVIDNSTNKVIRLLGFEFSNVLYPPGVVGHYFVIGDYENTVLGKGYSTPLPRMPSKTTDGYRQYIYGYTSGPGNMSKSGFESFISPEFLFDNRYVNGDHFKAERVFSPGPARHTDGVLDQGNVFSNLPDINTVGRDRKLVMDSNLDRKNSPARQFIAVSPQSNYYLEDEPAGATVITNYALNNRCFAFKADTSYGMDKITYGSIKVEKEVYTNIFGIRYRKMHTNYFTQNKTKFEVYGGSYYIGKLDYVNLLFYGFKPSLFNELFNGIIFGALWAIVRLLATLDFANAAREIRRVRREYFNRNGIIASLMNGNFRKSLNDSYGFIGDYLDNMYIESRLNIALLNESTDPDREIFRGGRVSPYVLRAMTFKAEDSNGKTYYAPRKEFVPEYFYSYNKDYSKLNDFVPYYPLAANYDYCKDCENEYPNRIIWSPVALDEDMYDLFRVHLVLDYKDTKSHKGAITGLTSRAGRLFIHTTQTTFVVPINQQQFETNVASVFITTGAFLNLEEQEAIESRIGSGGLQGKLSKVSTPYGDFWADQRKGEVIQISDGLQNVSNIGLGQWFRENLPLNLYKQLFEYGIHIEDSIADKAGIQLVYDPRFKRVILSKKDYKIIPENLKNEFILPTICEGSGNIIEDTDTETFSITGENPDTGIEGVGRLTLIPNSIQYQVEYLHKLNSSVNGVLELIPKSTFINLQRMNYGIPGNSAIGVGGHWISMQLRAYESATDTETILTIPMAPTTAVLTGCAGTVDVADLTYNGSNSLAFRTALRNVTVNYLCSLGYTNLVDFQITVGGALSQSPTLQTKHLPEGVWIGKRAAETDPDAAIWSPDGVEIRNNYTHIGGMTGVSFNTSREVTCGTVSFSHFMTPQFTDPYPDSWRNINFTGNFSYSVNNNIQQNCPIPKFLLNLDFTPDSIIWQTSADGLDWDTAQLGGNEFIIDPVPFAIRVIVTLESCTGIVTLQELTWISVEGEFSAMGELRIDSFGNIYRLTEEGEVLVPYTDRDVYEDLSFTISYSLEYGGWTSWHSYLPNYMFSGEFHYYTNLGSATYRHLHNNKFQEFYGVKYPMLIEMNKSGHLTKDLDTVHYYGYSLLWDDINKQWIDVSNRITFDHILVYNSDCSTGLLNVNFLHEFDDYYNNIDYLPGAVSVIRTDNNYKIAGLFDMSSSTPVITRSWEVVKEIINDYGYIDLVPINIDTDKPQYELNNLRGKFLSVRLFFKPEEDVKKIIHLAAPMEQNSVR